MLLKFKKIILANPRGFCAGVVRAIETVSLALKTHGSPVYVLHEIVHNKHVLSQLEELGAVFVENLTDVPTDAVVIFSAHGVARDVEIQAKTLALRTIDATCPLVSSVHRMVEKYHSEGYDIIIIGHHNHPEVLGTAGRVKDRVHTVSTASEVEFIDVVDQKRVAYVTQTTLSQDDIVDVISALHTKFPSMKGPSSNICYATKNRQDAVSKLTAKTDMLLVVGSKNSSNSNRLCEIGKRQVSGSYLIDDYKDINKKWFKDIEHIGITAGASAPERLVSDVVDWLQQNGGGEVQELDGVEEKIRFKSATLKEF